MYTFTIGRRVCFIFDGGIDPLGHKYNVVPGGYSFRECFGDNNNGVDLIGDPIKCLTYITGYIDGIQCVRGAINNFCLGIQTFDQIKKNRRNTAFKKDNVRLFNPLS